MPHAQQRNKALLPFLPTIRQSSLFRNIEPDDLEAMLGCINAQKSSYDKGEIILNSGSLNSKMGLVLEGVVRVEQCDCWGNRSIIATFAEGQSFGEVYACSPELPLDVDVVAANKTSILIMDVGRITTLCLIPAHSTPSLFVICLTLSLCVPIPSLAKLIISRKEIRAPSCFLFYLIAQNRQDHYPSTSLSTDKNLPIISLLNEALCAPNYHE